MRKMKLVVLLFGLTLFAQTEGNPVVIVNLPEEMQNQLTEAIAPAIGDLDKVMPECEHRQAIILVIPNPVRLQVIGQCLDEPEKQLDLREVRDEKSNR